MRSSAYSFWAYRYTHWLISFNLHMTVPLLQKANSLWCFNKVWGYWVEGFGETIVRTQPTRLFGVIPVDMLLHTSLGKSGVTSWYHHKQFQPVIIIGGLALWSQRSPPETMPHPAPWYHSTADYLQTAHTLPRTKVVLVWIQKPIVLPWRCALSRSTDVKD